MLILVYLFFSITSVHQFCCAPVIIAFRQGSCKYYCQDMWGNFSGWLLSLQKWICPEYWSFYSFRHDILPNKISHAAGVSWWYPLHFSGEFIWTFRVCGCSSLTNRPLLLSKCTNGNTVGIKYCQLISPECGVSAPWGDIHYGRSIIDEGEYMCNNS